MDRMLVITNAAAGSADDDAVRQALEVLETRGDVATVATSDRSDLEEAIRNRDGRSVVVAGGDGSLHAAVSVLYEIGQLEETTLGLIPLGTGNDFARTVGLAEDPAEAARTVLDGTATTLDLIVDDHDDIVVNAVHLGVGVDAGRESRQWKSRLGKLGYLIGAASAGLRSDGIRVRVIADDAVLADGRARLLQVAIANGIYVGGGTPIAPDARVDDGLADVVVSFAVSSLQRLVYAVLLRLGRHPADDQVTTTRAARVTVTGGPFGTNTDGELGDPVRERTWRVVPRAFRLMVPI